jgi:hypothetical protein
MKRFEFEYEKKDGSKSKRNVISLHASDKWVDGIDLTKLTEDEKIKMMQIQLHYEYQMKPFMTKGFRRFLKEGMTITHEETIKKTDPEGENT